MAHISHKLLKAFPNALSTSSAISRVKKNCCCRSYFCSKPKQFLAEVFLADNSQNKPKI